MNLSAQFKRGKPKREVKSVKGLKSYWGVGARGQQTLFLRGNRLFFLRIIKLHRSFKIKRNDIKIKLQLAVIPKTEMLYLLDFFFLRKINIGKEIQIETKLFHVIRRGK